MSTKMNLYMWLVSVRVQWDKETVLRITFYLHMTCHLLKTWTQWIRILGN